MAGGGDWGGQLSSVYFCVVFWRSRFWGERPVGNLAGSKVMAPVVGELGGDYGGEKLLYGEGNHIFL